jgi:hypothetical protein
MLAVTAPAGQMCDRGYSLAGAAPVHSWGLGVSVGAATRSAEEALERVEKVGWRDFSIAAPVEDAPGMLVREEPQRLQAPQEALYRLDLVLREGRLADGM